MVRCQRELGAELSKHGGESKRGKRTKSAAVKTLKIPCHAMVGAPSNTEATLRSTVMTGIKNLLPQPLKVRYNLHIST